MRVLIIIGLLLLAAGCRREGSHDVPPYYPKPTVNIGCVSSTKPGDQIEVTFLVRWYDLNNEDYYIVKWIDVTRPRGGVYDRRIDRDQPWADEHIDLTIPADGFYPTRWQVTACNQAGCNSSEWINFNPLDHLKFCVDLAP